MTIGFVGLSHLGIVTSLAAASKGFDVIGHDPDPALCEELGAGRLPVFEPGLPELLQANRARIQFTHDAATLSRCDLVVFAPDIPTDADNRSDVSALGRLIAQALPHVSAEATVVVLSQVPPGFTRALARQHAARKAGMYAQVETLVFGNAVERACHPERFIVGCEHPDTPLPRSYAQWLDVFGCPIARMRYESAELAKIAVNLLLVSSVSTANTLAELCEQIGADWSEIAPVLRLDRRIGPHAYLNAGLGIAGGNLERDLMTVKTLAETWGTEAGVVDAWFLNSAHRREWVLRAVHDEVVPRRAEPTIAVWGLAYKADTTSTKNSPALALLEALAPFALRVYDPQVVLPPNGVARLTQSRSALEACRGADALAIMTPWREFSTVDVAAVREHMAGRVILDPYGVLDRARCEALGFAYRRLGAPR